MFNSRQEIAIEERTQAGGQSSEGIEAVHKILERIQLMFKLSANKISLAASALVLCAGFAQAQTLPGSPLTAAPASVSIGFTLPSTAGAAQAVVFTVPVADVSVPFVVDPTTVPFWLSINDMADNAVPSPGLSVNFVASAAAGALGVGAYSASVHVKVNGDQDLVMPVTLTVTSAAPVTLSVMNGGTAVASGGTVALNWVYGAALPTVTLTLLSNDYPISFSAASTVSGSSPEDWILLSSASGIAYNYGTPLTVTFAQDALMNSSVGTTLAGHVTISYAATTYTVNFTILVGEPAPVVTSIFPQEVPTQSSGALTVVVTGSGFGTTLQGFTTATQVKIAYGIVTATDLTTITAAGGGGATGTVTPINPTTMILSIPWEDGTPVSILNTAHTVTISINNGGAPVTVSLYVTAKPIIYSVTDAAALMEATPGTQPNVSPYQTISIFGNNFCPTCVAPVVAPIASSRYPTTLTAPVGGGGHALTVTFFKSDGITSVGSAYILFATNTQINALVPSTVAAADDPMQVVVSYNSILSNTNVLYEVNGVAATPGIFTTSTNGQGQGAILLANGTVNSSASNSTKAVKGQSVSIYLSGLGAPNSTGADTAATKAAKFPTSCISVANYVATAALNPVSADGAVLVAADIATNTLPPCFATANQVAVSIGGKTATVTYAGWVSGSVAGLYQVNATVPTSAASGTAIPVVVTTGGVSSQAGVTMAIQ